MPYVALIDLHGQIPPEFLTQALDDNGDGTADAGIWDAVAAAAAAEVDGMLGQRYAVPFSYPYPALVAHAARLFALDALYKRRGLSGDKNPWEKSADDMRTKLGKVGAGKEPLGPGYDRAKASVSVVKETSKTTSRTGRIAA
jgi:phage gp36-like protein